MKNEVIQWLTISIDELLHAIGIRRHAILQHRSRVRQHPLLVGLPEPAANRPRLVWWRRDIEAWVSSRLTFRPSDPAAQPEPSEQPSRRGRPRKTSPAPDGQEGGTK
jgi:hypothetical protein